MIIQQHSALGPSNAGSVSKDPAARAGRYQAIPSGTTPTSRNGAKINNNQRERVPSGRNQPMPIPAASATTVWIAVPPRAAPVAMSDGVSGRSIPGIAGCVALSQGSAASSAATAIRATASRPTVAPARGRVFGAGCGTAGGTTVRRTVMIIRTVAPRPSTASNISMITEMADAPPNSALTSQRSTAPEASRRPPPT